MGKMNRIVFLADDELKARLQAEAKLSYLDVGPLIRTLLERILRIIDKERK